MHVGVFSFYPSCGCVLHSLCCYTVFDGYGSKDRMNMIFIVLPRRDTQSVLKEIRRLCSNNVFVVVDDVNKYSGGYGMVK